MDSQASTQQASTQQAFAQQDFTQEESAQQEPPSSPHSSSLTMIGRDRAGHWVVQDQSGLHGGLFINRAQALKYALFENGHRPQAVVMVPGILELNLAGRAAASSARNSNTPALRHAAA
jgi:hypothetical protein